MRFRYQVYTTNGQPFASYRFGGDASQAVMDIRQQQFIEGVAITAYLINI